MRITAVLCVKNEAAYLIEWLAHHKSIGITDFLVLSNDCDDGTDLMLDHLQDMGELTHIRNDGPYDKKGIQWSALKLASDHALVKQADWLITLDIDEFINVHLGDHSIQALINVLPNADAIALTWRMFGNAGIVSYEDKPVTQQFTKTAKTSMHWPWRAFMFKTLYRNNGLYKRLGIHRPASPDKERVMQAQWFGCGGHKLDAHYSREGIFSDPRVNNYSFAQMNHYALGSMENYLLKCDRGRINRGENFMSMDYWCERNWNCVTDRTIHQTYSRSTPWIVKYHSDEKLKSFHQKGVAWRQNRIRMLLNEEHYRSLFGRLLVTPSSQPITQSTFNLLHKHTHSEHKTIN